MKKVNFIESPEVRIYNLDYEEISSKRLHWNQIKIRVPIIRIALNLSSLF